MERAVFNLMHRHLLHTGMYPSGRKIRELFCPDPLAGLIKWRDFKFFWPKNKLFPLITWKEQAIYLQKLKAVVITFSLPNFLQE